MVPKNDGSKEARPATLEELIELCRSLNSKKAKYVVIGGMAMLHHGFVRATQDIDLLVDSSLENEEAVISALLHLPDKAASDLKPGEIKQYEVIRVADEIVVDLMAKAYGLTYQDAEKRIQFAEIEGVRIPFASVALMLDLKKSVRPKDQMDREFLMELQKQKA